MSQLRFILIFLSINISSCFGMELNIAMSPEYINAKILEFASNLHNHDDKVLCLRIGQTMSAKKNQKVLLMLNNWMNNIEPTGYNQLDLFDIDPALSINYKKNTINKITNIILQNEKSVHKFKKKLDNIKKITSSFSYKFNILKLLCTCQLSNCIDKLDKNYLAKSNTYSNIRKAKKNIQQLDALITIIREAPLAPYFPKSELNGLFIVIFADVNFQFLNI